MSKLWQVTEHTVIPIGLVGVLLLLAMRFANTETSAADAKKEARECEAAVVEIHKDISNLSQRTARMEGMLQDVREQIRGRR